MRLMRYLFILALFFFFFIVTIPILLPGGFFLTHDGEAHVARFAAYFKAFIDGQFPARWAGNLNYQFGSPIFIFYYPLPGHVASLVHFLGISFEDTFKILIASAFSLSPLTFYLWIKDKFTQPIAVAGALLYGLAPYHLLNLFVRGDIAELFAFIFIPLVLYWIDSFTKTHSLHSLLLGGISYGLLILAHNGISLMFTPILIIYAHLIGKSHKEKLLLSFLFMIGLSISAFFWLPALYESKYVTASYYLRETYLSHFPTLLQLIYPPWGFGPDVQKEGGLSPQIGGIPITTALLGIVYIIKSKKKNIVEIFFVFIFLFSVFITTSFSLFLWKYIPILKYYEFPWRFTALSSFSTVFLSCIFFSKVKSKLVLFLFMIFFFLSILPMLRVREIESRLDEFYFHYPGTTYYHGEASSIWTAGDFSQFPKSPIEVIDGEGTVTNYTRKTHIHTYTISAQTPVRLLDNTTFFPGWNVYIDRKKTAIEFQDMNHRGLITFRVPEGKHTIITVFEETRVRFIADMISLISVFFIIGIVIMRKRITTIISST